MMMMMGEPFEFVRTFSPIAAYSPRELGVQVRREIRRHRRVGNHVGGDDHAERQDAPGRGRRRGGLPAKKRAAVPRRDGDGDQRRDPPDALVAVEDVVSAERDEEGQDADDDDADDGREGAAGDGREALPADDAVDDAEPGQRGEVQDDGHGDGVAPEAEARLDHLAQAGPGAQGAQVRGGEGGQEGEEDDDEGAVPEAQAVGGTQHAEREREEIHVHAEPDGELGVSKREH